jgi:hypothetical protein
MNVVLREMRSYLDISSGDKCPQVHVCIYHVIAAGIDSGQQRRAGWEKNNVNLSSQCHALGELRRS